MLHFLAIALLQFSSITTVATAKAPASSHTINVSGDIAALGGVGGWGGDIAALGGVGGWGGDIAA